MPSRLQESRGYTLLEMSLVLVIGTALIATWAANEVGRRLDDNVRAQATAMKGPILGAVNQYLTERYSELTKAGGGSIVGVGNPLRPTIAELRSLGMLKDPVKNTAFNGGAYRIVVTQYPMGCVAPNCNLDAILYVDRPITDWRNNIDYARLGLAVRTIGDDGAMSTAASPESFIGLAGKWSTTNPAGSRPGLLAARTGYNSAMFSQFYRRDGSLPITGDVAASGYNINDAGRVNATKVNLPAGDSLQIGDAKIFGDNANAAIRSPSGYIYIQDAVGTPGTVSASNGRFTGTVTAGSVNANETTSMTSRIFGNQTVYGTQQVGGVSLGNNVIYLAPQAWAGSTCMANTLTTDPNGTLLTCKQGVWQASGDVPSGTACGFSQDNRYDWTGPQLCMGHNPWDGCPNGYYQGYVASIKGETTISCIKS